MQNNKYTISYYPIEDLIKHFPERLHDTSWLKKFIKTSAMFRNRNISHFHLVMMASYKTNWKSGLCSSCKAEREDDDWDYCPWCGGCFRDSLDLFAETELEIIKHYKDCTGEYMPDEEQAKIHRYI